MGSIVSSKQMIPKTRWVLVAVTCDYGRSNNLCFSLSLQSSGDASFREMLRSLSQMSKLWKDIQDELSYAVTDLEVS